MNVRPATEADIPAEREVFVTALGELMRRHGFPAPDPPLERFAAVQRHLQSHDGERCLVAEDDGRVVAFSAAIVRGDAWFLCALFVHPAVQARGVGRRLLELSWGEGFARRLTITDSIQPISNGLYARRGLVPATPILGLRGRPRARHPQGLVAAPPDADALAALDLAVYGFDRSVDHRFWATRARGTLWLRAGEPAAYSYAADGGGIGPIAGMDAGAAADALRAELAHGDGRPVDVVVPGSARELVAAALEGACASTRRPAFSSSRRVSTCRGRSRSPATGSSESCAGTSAPV